MFRSDAEIDPNLRSVLEDLACGRKPWPLYLWGPPGTGKTCAVLVMLDRYGPCRPACNVEPVIRDWSAGFIRVADLSVLIDADKGKYHWSREGQAGDVTRENLIRVIDNAPLVVLDEIGVTSGGLAKPYNLNTLRDFLDRRCSDPPVPLIVTGNLPPSELAQLWDDRIADRLLRGTRYRCDGPSKRTGR